MASDEQANVTPQEEWEANNESYRFEPPEGPPEQWSGKDFTALYDRLIGRKTTWTCDKCSKPSNSLQKARRHVKHQHGERLIDQYAGDSSD